MDKFNKQIKKTIELKINNEKKALNSKKELLDINREITNQI